MLRRRVDRGESNNDIREKLIESAETPSKISKNNIHSVSSLYAVLLIIAGVILFDVIVKLEKSVPRALTIADEKNYPNRFIAERAQNHLKQLTSLGPRVTGSYENEVLAVEFLKREINFIIQQANRNQKIELDHQKVSGVYFLDFKPNGLINAYDNVQNIVVRLESGTGSNHSLLLNCHFDSVPTSPGGSDNGINCAVMIEVLRVISRESTRPEHNIIFLFNGAEENPLQASHGFVTKHKWAKEARAVINLEAAGAAGRECLFQAGPGNNFLIRSYAQNAPHPFAQSIAEEIFQLNLIPSDTDLRIFRDFGRIPGLDFAFASNGYVYHTKFDGFENIPAGSYQHVGDNILAIVKSLANSPELPTASLKSREKYVYFDYFGYFMIAYNEQTALYVNAIAIFASVFIFFKMVYDLRKGSLLEIMVNVLLGGGTQAAGWVISLVFTIVFTFFLDQLNLTMTWYSRPKIIFGLYFCPTMIFLSMFLVAFNIIVENVSLSLGTRAQIYAHTSRLMMTFWLLVTTVFAIRSSYIFLIPVIFNTLAFFIISFFNLQLTRRTWLYVYLISSILPTIYSMYSTTLFLQLFIPITARFGANKNPDDYIGVLSALGCVMITSFFVPLVALIRKPATVIVGLLMTFFVTFALIGITNYGFPYSDNPSSPSPQRYYIYHTSRLFHDESGKVKKQDSGYAILNMDRNSPRTVAEVVPDFDNAVSVEQDCEQVIFCGMPLMTSRWAAKGDDFTWIPAPPPVIHEPATLKLVTEPTRVSSTVRRYTFHSAGPDHYNIYISPKSNITLTRWSFLKEVPEDKDTYTWNGRPVYFIRYGYGQRAQKWDFWIEVELPSADWNKPLMDIAISGLYIHHEKSHTDQYRQFLDKFPSWTQRATYMGTYQSWIY